MTSKQTHPTVDPAFPEEDNVIIEILPGRQKLPKSLQATMPMQVTISARKNKETAKTWTYGVNLALAIDCSVSMNSLSRLSLAKEAAYRIIGQLNSEDKVSVVKFADEAILLTSGHSGGDSAFLCRLIQRLEAGGCTDLHSGWLTGAQAVAANYEECFLNRVILLSDGLANRGVTDKTAIMRHVGEIAETGVSTTLVGLGNGFNEDLMEGMAEAGDGNYHYAEVADDLPARFLRELDEQRQVMGTQVVVNFRSTPGLVIDPPLNNLPKSADGSYRLGNLVAGKSHHLILQVTIPPDLAEPEIEVVVQWLDSKGKKQEKLAVLKQDRVADAEYEKLTEEVGVSLQTALLKCATLKHAAGTALQNKRPGTAQHLLEEAIGLLDEFINCPSAFQMIETLHREQMQIRRGEYGSSQKTLKHQSSRMRYRSEIV